MQALGDVELIIFDWDGTVVDSTPTITQAILNACRDIGIRVPAAEDASWVIGLGPSRCLVANCTEPVRGAAGAADRSFSISLPVARQSASALSGNDRCL